ncbi:hypothetical protein HMPREF1057_03353 [Bacteroides finegoldii CL09T03C10]|uniref:Uncharacterized protein n=1 Tax=Bacteroides finegoldii CL09T03C10 TaxID=997888 RepID=K5BSB7_9BACE|nr:hypothetical protein HMPREF1057_03353 [Bacteroides finegoldii CL09T03C10]
MKTNTQLDTTTDKLKCRGKMTVTVRSVRTL